MIFKPFDLFELNKIRDLIVLSFVILCIGTTMNTIAIPIIPAQPISIHNRTVMIIVSTGPVHRAFKSNEAKSKRLTSFDNKFTTFPGAVSPKAVCDKRRA